MLCGRKFGCSSCALAFSASQIAGAPSYGTCRIGYWHRPLTSDGTVHGDNPDVAPFWDALAGHASIVLNGQALNMTVTSYDHQLHFGLIGCRRTVPHLQRLLVHLESSLADLELIH